MKKSLVLAVLSAVACALPGLHAVTLDSPISAVTVYPDRAVVTRRATVDLAPGLTALVFPELPPGLIESSLQAGGSGTARVTLLDVTAHQTFLATTPDPRRHDLEQQIDALQQQDRTLADKATVWQGQSDLINRLLTSAVAPGAGEKSERPRLDDVKAALDYGQKQLLEIAASLQQLDRQRSDLRDQLTALQRQLSQLTGPGERSVKRVIVRVQADTAGTLDLTLNYTVPGAGWTPGYDARVQTGDRTVQLSYFGNVRQNTGEDWKDVALTLSTARPSLGGQAPTLNPWTLDVYVPRPVPLMDSGELKNTGGYVGNRPALAARAMAAPEIQLAADAQATVESAATSATFKVAAPASIASDNSVQKVPVTIVPLSAELSYATTPKLRETAYLHAKVVNTSDYPLLGGALNVFLDGTFVATGRLATTMPGEKFSLALGADEGIAVKHVRVRKFTEETGLISNGHRLTYEYRLTIQNHKRTAARVIVNDQVPVSRNEKIVVKVLAPAADEAKPNDAGKLQWTLDLKPGEKRELTVKFTVDYPDGVTVSGLE
ncbi:MAG: mucoidy inhibitor MuiA family protein [Opitutales bacterium]